MECARPDQRSNKEAIEELIERKYKEIDGNYKMLRKASNIKEKE